MKIHILDHAEDDLVDGYNFYEDQAPISMRIKRPGLEYISWIAFTRTLSRLCCMPEYIGSSTKIIGGCCRKDFLSQFIILFPEIR